MVSSRCGPHVTRSLPEQVKDARTAVEMLIRGVPHEAVFAFLDRKRKEAQADLISYYY